MTVLYDATARRVQLLEEALHSASTFEQVRSAAAAIVAVVDQYLETCAAESREHLRMRQSRCRDTL